MTAFTKPALAAQQQRETLVQRGLRIQDTARADRLLEVVTLFRLSPYMRVFQDSSPEHRFVNGASLNAIHSLYQFDSELRQLVMRGIERVEVAARSAMSNELCSLHNNPHWYLEPELPPFWAVVETMSFGGVSHLFQGLSQDRARKLVATRFALPQVVLESWLHTLTFVRNICAHHGRLWNRELAIPPKWPHSLAQVTGIEPQRLGRRFFTIAMLLTYLTQVISPESQWLNRLETLLEQHPEVDLNAMGFPANWHEQLLKIANEAALQTEQERNEP